MTLVLKTFVMTTLITTFLVTLATTDIGYYSYLICTFEFREMAKAILEFEYL